MKIKNEKLLFFYLERNRKLPINLKGEKRRKTGNDEAAIEVETLSLRKNTTSIETLKKEQVKRTRTNVKTEEVSSSF